MTAAIQVPQHGLQTHGTIRERALDWAAWLLLKANGGPIPSGIQISRASARDLSAILRRAARILRTQDDVVAEKKKPASSQSLKHAPRFDVETPEGVRREVWLDWLDRMAASERTHMKFSKRAAVEFAALLRAAK